MNLNQIKKLVTKGIKGSGEKQLKVFLQNKKTTKIFKEIVNGSDPHFDRSGYNWIHSVKKNYKILS